MTTVWVNGCFDILHRGHIELFKHAKSLGDYLVVGVDTDERVRDSKGLSRPINNLQDRVEILEAIKYIDEAVSFSADHELEKEILQSGASIMVVGSDYRDKRVIGSHLVNEVVFFERIGSYSTTNIVGNS